MGMDEKNIAYVCTYFCMRDLVYRMTVSIPWYRRRLTRKKRYHACF